MVASDGTLSIDEAAVACGVSTETIRRRIRADRLTGAHRVGPAGAWRIPVAALLADGFRPLLNGRDEGTRDADLAVRVAVAEAISAERLARITALERHVNHLESLFGLPEVAR